jgi:H+-transporting ATPase
MDLIKWALCWTLNEDGFRDPEAALHKSNEAKSVFKKVEEVVVAGAGSSAANPLGRVSLSKTPADVLDKRSASVVAVTRDGTGAIKMNTDSSSNIAIARNSMKKTEK